MEGFDLEATRRYYGSIVAQAWRQAEELGEVELRTKSVDRDLPWLLVADDGHERFERWHTAGYHYHPLWMRHAGVGLPTGGGGGGGGGGAGGGLPAPSFGDVSASFAGWFEGVGQQLTGTVQPATSSLRGKDGVVSFGGMDKALGQALAAMAKNSGGGGGGRSGGGCACACAGCACACACAGGGR
jgi:hypothetical protein